MLQLIAIHMNDKRFLRRFLLVILFMMLNLNLVHCNSKKKSQGNNPARFGDAPFVLTFLEGNPFANKMTQLENHFFRGLSSIQINNSYISGINSDTLWSLSQCQCSPNLTSRIFENLALSPGALPQPLVPAIREEVKNNKALQLLLKIPSDGLARFLSGIVSFFMTDEKINKKIRESLTAKIEKALGSSSDINSLNYRFDLFQSPITHATNPESFIPQTVNFDLQAAKWAFVMSAEPMWADQQATGVPTTLMGHSDHGLQLLVTANMLSEWSYIFSLDTSSDGSSYGGLSFDPELGIQAPLEGYDPRNTQEKPHIVSGNYAVKFSSSNSITLATQTQEVWSRNSEPVELNEQAKIWAAAAMAYNRLKPSARSAQEQLLYAPETGMFPDNVHSIALTHLLGMSTLLNGKFFDLTERKIFAMAILPGIDKSRVSPAPLHVVSRLARALQLWIQATQDVQQDRLDQAITQKIQASQTSLKDAVRLSVQNILSDHVVNSLPQSRLQSIALVRSRHQLQPPTMGEAAETLAILAFIDQTTLNTPQQDEYFATDLRVKIIGLYHWFASEYLLSLTQTMQGVQLSPTDVLWTYIALKQLKQYPQELHHAAWLDAIVQSLEQAISKWDQGLRTGGF